MTLKRFFRGIRVGMEMVLRLPFINWFNPILTVYLNLRSFPLRQAIKMPVFVYGWPKLFTLLGSMECMDVCKMGMIKFNSMDIGGPDYPGMGTALNNWGKIVFYGSCVISTGIKINVFRFGTLELGKDCRIMPNSIISVWSSVHIGAKTRVAHRSQIMDSNYHYIVDIEKKTVRRRENPIYIGDCVWICNSATITAGAKIPSHSIVASHSLVNKDFSDVPEGSIIGGTPAKLLKTNSRRVFNPKLEQYISKYFKENPESSVFQLDADFDASQCD